MSNKIEWYKQAQNEFVGADATYADYPINQDVKNVNQGPSLPPEYTELGPTEINGLPDGVPQQCPRCKSTKRMKVYPNMHNDEGEVAWACSCGETNMPILKGLSRVKKRVVKRRSYFSSKMQKTSQYNNSFNTPLSREDLNEDQRIQPWYLIKDQFEQKYDSVRQMDHRQYKLVKVKNPDGSFRFVRMKIQNMAGDGVTPANSYISHGTIMQQHRYNPEEPKDNAAGGSWAHNRNGNEGWYGMPNANNLDLDLRERAIPWDKYVSERSKFFLGLTKPI